MYNTQNDYVFKQLEECQTNGSWYEINNENAKYLYNYINNLQQRIDKAIIFAYKNIDNVLTRDTLVSILQDEKAKDNEI